MTMTEKQILINSITDLLKDTNDLDLLRLILSILVSAGD